MFRAALHMVISDFKVFIVFVALGLPFPQVHLSVGGGGGGGGQQASSLCSKHKLWNFHRSCMLVSNNALCLQQIMTGDY